jgi:hypothetical protein
MRYKKDHPVSYFHGETAFEVYESSDLIDLVYDAIEVLETTQYKSDEQMFDAIASKVNDRRLAINLFRLIPIAYCRHIFSRHNFSDQYELALSDFEPDIFFFSKNRLFNEVSSIVAHRLMQNPKPTPEMIQNVLTECDDFNIIKTKIQNGHPHYVIDLPVVHFKVKFIHC